MFAMATDEIGMVNRKKKLYQELSLIHIFIFVYQFLNTTVMRKVQLLLVCLILSAAAFAADKATYKKAIDEFLLKMCIRDSLYSARL